MGKRTATGISQEAAAELANNILLPAVRRCLKYGTVEIGPVECRS